MGIWTMRPASSLFLFIINLFFSLKTWLLKKGEGQPLGWLAGWARSCCSVDNSSQDQGKDHCGAYQTENTNPLSSSLSRTTSAQYRRGMLHGHLPQITRLRRGSEGTGGLVGMSFTSPCLTANLHSYCGLTFPFSFTRTVIR